MLRAIVPTRKVSAHLRLLWDTKGPARILTRRINLH